MDKNDWLVRVDNKVARGVLCGVPQNLICERLLFASIGKFNPDRDDSVVQFNIKHIMKGGTGAEQKKRIDALCTKMFGCHISETRGECEWKIAVFSSMVVDKQARMITAKFNKDIMPYIIDLKSEFTMIPVESYLGLSTKYSAILYRLLKSYSGLGKNAAIRIPPEELVEKLGAPERAVKDSWWFKKKILEPALKEINDVMDIKIVYRTSKESRKIDRYIFFIDMKVSVKKQQADRKAKEFYANNPELAKRKRESVKIARAENAVECMEATGEIEGFLDGIECDSINSDWGCVNYDD